MSWFKVDDKFHTSEPVKRIPRSMRMGAVGLWTLAGSWSADHLKDGFVPEFMLDELGGTPEQADALVSVRLWRRVRDGYRFTEWAEWQQTRESVEANRKAERDRKAEYRARIAGKPGPVPDAVPVGQERDSGVPRPDPTRPDPTTTAPPIGGVARGRGSRIPEPFMLTREMREWAAAEGITIDLDRATRMFVDYWRGVSGARGTKIDWIATWRNWVRKDAGDAKPVRESKSERAAGVLQMGRDLAHGNGQRELA